MRLIFATAILCVCFTVSACGKRPNVLETPVNKNPVSNGYPAVEAVPQ